MIATISLDKSSLDLSKDDVLILDYTQEDISKGISFKIGWESVVVDSSASGIATVYPPSKSICITPNGKTNIAYIGSGSDLYYSNSSNDMTFTTIHFMSSTC